MPVAEARALCPKLETAPADPERDARALRALAQWMTRYTPVASPEPPDAIFLNVEGCEPLYRGMNAMIGRVRQGLAGLGLESRIAVAPTAGAAWAVASCGRDGAVVAEGEIAATLAPLPVASLRLDPGTVAVLEHLGVRAVKELVALPRTSLPARFGTAVLNRLDAALGRAAEPLVAVDYPITIGAGMEFEGTVESLEVLELATRRLVDRVVAKLRSHGLGARLLRATFKPPYGAPVIREVRLTRPARDAKTLFKLLSHPLESVESDDGFLLVRVDVPAFERVSEGQWALFEQQGQAGEEDVDRLVELLQARLGERVIARPQFVESYIPERGYRLADPLSTASGICVIDDSAPRPPYLFPMPIEVRVVVSPSDNGEGLPLSFTHQGKVHRLTYADGPERIDGVWWEGHDKTRDYFDVEDEDGRRFWVFRVGQSGRWFLHGAFA